LIPGILADHIKEWEFGDRSPISSKENPIEYGPEGKKDDNDRYYGQQGVEPGAEKVVAHPGPKARRFWGADIF
jgi:hypothetical protein